METLTLAGKLENHDWGEASDILFVLPTGIYDTWDDPRPQPIGEWLQDNIADRKVTIRYWLSDCQLTKDQVQMDFMKSIMGLAACNFGSVYSEYTGYLWTNEDCTVGGHDLLEELRLAVGKWLILEVDIHDER